MADTQPSQQWRHGWIPLTPAAARSKNHGRKPGKNSALSRIVAEAAEAAKTLRQNAQSAAGPDGTPPPKWTGLSDRKPATLKGKTPTRTTTPKPATTKAAAPQAATPAPKPAAKAPTKPAAKPAKAGAKAGTDSRNTTLRVGDPVSITEGAHRGKTGRVVGKGKSGAVKVDVDGNESDFSPMNLRSRSDQETSQKVDAGIRAAAGRPTTPETQSAPKPAQREQSIEATQAEIRGVYDKLAKKPGDWVSITKLRPLLTEGLGRDHVDEALRLLNRKPNVNIVPEANQKMLSPADRAAAVHIGNQDKHLISFVK